MIKAINSLPVKKKFSLRSKIIGNNFSPLNNMIINIEKYLINAKKNKFNFKNFILYLFEEFRDILIYLYQIIKKQ